MTTTTTVQISAEQHKRLQALRVRLITQEQSDVLLREVVDKVLEAGFAALGVNGHASAPTIAPNGGLVNVP